MLPVIALLLSEGLLLCAGYELLHVIHICSLGEMLISSSKRGLCKTEVAQLTC